MLGIRQIYMLCVCVRVCVCVCVCVHAHVSATLLCACVPLPVLLLVFIDLVPQNDLRAGMLKKTKAHVHACIFLFFFAGRKVLLDTHTHISNACTYTYLCYHVSLHALVNLSSFPGRSSMGKLSDLLHPRKSLFAMCVCGIVCVSACVRACVCCVCVCDV